MAKESNKTIIAFVSVSVLIILAIAFLTSISEQTLLTTQKTLATNETTNLSVACYVGGQVNVSDADCNITVTYAPTGWEKEDSDCYLSNVVVSNATGTALTLTTDYVVFSTTGIIQMKNTTSTNSTKLGNNVLIDYNYCSSNYMADSWARTVLNLNPGLFAIAILLAVVAVVYLLLNRKDED